MLYRERNLSEATTSAHRCGASPPLCASHHLKCRSDCSRTWIFGSRSLQYSKSALSAVFFLTVSTLTPKLSQVCAPCLPYPDLPGPKLAQSSQLFQHKVNVFSKCEPQSRGSPLLLFLSLSNSMIFFQAVPVVCPFVLGFAPLFQPSVAMT
jgi:hypothetical protein